MLHLVFTCGERGNHLCRGMLKKEQKLLQCGLPGSCCTSLCLLSHIRLREGFYCMLQGSRMRNTKTDYVSCPSCGRTLFDLQEVTDQIRQRTGHLPGVSIAIMGCIVNGPGEMADADFG